MKYLLIIVDFRYQSLSWYCLI